uniref:Uncharacterized protein n=1 Tax=Glossina brevipalpis TaxID=37001 RepID=A0A1A9WHU4_9MUSC
MNSKDFYFIMLTVMMTIFTNRTTTALPAESDYISDFISTPLDSFNSADNNYLSSRSSSSEPLPRQQRDSLLNRLNRGYYYIDNGVITPVSGARRQEADNVIFTPPLERYKRTETKHKKLFVPNLFG